MEVGCNDMAATPRSSTSTTGRDHRPVAGNALDKVTPQLLAGSIRRPRELFPHALHGRDHGRTSGSALDKVILRLSAGSIGDHEDIKEK